MTSRPFRRLCSIAAAMTAVIAPAAATASAATPAPKALPHPDHVVVVVFENEQYGAVIGNKSAPYLSGLAKQGASFTNSYGVTHPSQPNYLALFSGDTQGVTDDSCPQDRSGVDNLGNQLLANKKTFVGYSESMPSDGFTGCSGSSSQYMRKHNPWVNFDNVPASSNVTYKSFPSDYSKLPTVSFVTPNMCDDMHNCPIPTGDNWAKSNLDGYAQWAKAHNSLLIVTFDEDDSRGDNKIPTVFVGQGVKAGDYPEKISHYTVLRTIEDMNGLPALGKAANESAISDIWG